MYDMMLADSSGTKKKEYLKAKIEELETNSKIKTIRDLKLLGTCIGASMTLKRVTSIELI